MLHFFFCAHPIFFLRALSFSLSFSLDVTQIHCHSAGVLPPPHRRTRLLFHRDKTPALSFFVDSHRTAPTHAVRRSQQLIPFSVFFFRKKVKSPTHVRYDPHNKHQQHSRVTTSPGRPAFTGLPHSFIHSHINAAVRGMYIQ